MSRILLVDDSPHAQRMGERILTDDGYEVVAVSNADSALIRLEDVDPDIVIADTVMPGRSGYEICRKVRAEGIQTPILMLTARGEEADRVLGLDLGADDYVAKPFSIRELMARIRALLRRAQPPKALPGELRFDDVVVNFVSYEAHKAGRPLEMTRKEFQLLRLLASRTGEVVARDELLNEVWGYENYPTTRTVDNHIAGLRAKIESEPSEPRHLKTVHGVGYKFVA